MLNLVSPAPLTSLSSERLTLAAAVALSSDFPMPESMSSGLNDCAGCGNRIRDRNAAHSLLQGVFVPWQATHFAMCRVVFDH